MGSKLYVGAEIIRKLFLNDSISKHKRLTFSRFGCHFLLLFYIHIHYVFCILYLKNQLYIYTKADKTKNYAIQKNGLPAYQ